MAIKIYVGALLIFSFILLSTTVVKDPVQQVERAQTSTLIDTTIVFERGRNASVNVHFKQLQDSFGLNIGTLVVLPGWNYSSLDWCNKTKLCNYAEQLGYNLILIDMSKSVYASQHFRETRRDMKKYATRTWVKDTLIPYFQEKYQLLTPGANNFVLGLSTGGRGASLLCLDLPNIFKKGAALSGDFNQNAMPKDNLMSIFYGPHSKFQDRWTGNDNVVFNLSRFEVPFYLGHGIQDKVVPYQQTVEFYDSLLVYQPELEVRIHLDSLAKHDYSYWSSEVPNVLGFFLE